MFIAYFNLILQVTHATSIQYKYKGYTINFLQEVKEIEKLLSHPINEL